jgi:hypothetical protein
LRHFGENSCALAKIVALWRK